MPVMTASRTLEFSVRPWAITDLEASGAALDAILTALEHDPRALGPVCGYDAGKHQVDALFQVELDPRDDPTVSDAAELARALFADALEHAGLSLDVAGVSVVQGGDPDLLP